MNKKILSIACLFILAVSVFFILFGIKGIEGATVVLEKKSAALGLNDIIVPVKLLSAKRENISALSLNIIYDDSKMVFKGADVGDSAVKADKTIQSSVSSKNKIIIVLFGLNNKIISDGEIARLKFDVLEDALPGRAILYISKALGADYQANKVMLKGGSKEPKKSFLIKRRPR